MCHGARRSTSSFFPTAILLLGHTAAIGTMRHPRWFNILILRTLQTLKTFRTPIFQGYKIFKELKVLATAKVLFFEPENKKKQLFFLTFFIV